MYQLRPLAKGITKVRLEESGIHVYFIQEDPIRGHNGPFKVYIFTESLCSSSRSHSTANDIE